MQTGGRDRAVEEVMGRARALDTRLEVGLLRVAKTLFSNRDGTSYGAIAAPGWRLHGASVSGSAEATREAVIPVHGRTRKSNAAEQRAAIEKPIAGNGSNR